MKETLHKIETLLETSPNLSQDRKEALLALLAELRQELNDLASSNQDAATTVAGYARLAVHESIKSEPEKDPNLIENTKKGLELSIQKFEQSHPKLAGLISAINMTLSNLGV